MFLTAIYYLISVGVATWLLEKLVEFVILIRRRSLVRQFKYFFPEFPNISESQQLLNERAMFRWISALDICLRVISVLLALLLALGAIEGAPPEVQAASPWLIWPIFVVWSIVQLRYLLGDVYAYSKTDEMGDLVRARWPLG